MNQPVAKVVGAWVHVAEYVFGLCLSRLQRRHSVDCEQSRMPGNRSEQVEHCSESSEAMHACEHETSAPSFKLNAFQIIEAVTAPPVRVRRPYEINIYIYCTSSHQTSRSCGARSGSPQLCVHPCMHASVSLCVYAFVLHVHRGPCPQEFLEIHP